MLNYAHGTRHFIASHEARTLTLFAFYAEKMSDEAPPLLNTSSARMAQQPQENKPTNYSYLICLYASLIHDVSECGQSYALPSCALWASNGLCWENAQCGVYKLCCGRRHYLRPLLKSLLLQQSIFHSTGNAPDRNVRALTLNHSHVWNY